MNRFWNTFGVFIAVLISAVIFYINLSISQNYYDSCGGAPWNEFTYEFGRFWFMLTGKC